MSPKTLKKPQSPRPNIPIHIFLQEAEDLLVWIEKDKDELIRIGLDWKEVEDLPLKIKTLKEAQAKWDSVKFDFRKHKADWKVRIMEGRNLRSELLHSLYQILKAGSVDYLILKRIAKGKSNAAVILSLAELAELGKKHIPELAALGINTQVLDIALSKSFELSAQQAKLIAILSEPDPNLVERSEAYFQLKASVTKIREKGQYAFWKNEFNYKGYVSKYRQKANRHRKNLPGLPKNSSAQAEN